jgi:Flp pilus assembly protein protease CpaA
MRKERGLPEVTVESTIGVSRQAERDSIADLLRRPTSAVVVGACLIISSLLAGPLLGLHVALIIGFAGCGLAAGIDLTTGLIPNRLVAPLIVVALVCSLVASPDSFTSPLLGAVIVAGPWFVLAMTDLGIVGGGDVKLCIALGLLLGAVGLRVAGYGLAGSFVIWWVHAAVTRLSGRRAFRFGPGLVTSALVAIWMSQLTGVPR